jgi:hypothetical protein
VLLQLKFAIYLYCDIIEKEKETANVAGYLQGGLIVNLAIGNSFFL